MASEDATTAPPKKKGLRQQIADLQEKLEKEKAKAEDYLNRLKYLQAEFENFRKRTERTVSDSIQSGNAKLIARFLPVIDDLERAVSTNDSSNDAKTVLRGVELVLKDLREILKGEGVTVIETVGRTFDPNIHDAVKSVETTEVAENAIVRELRKGYQINGKVIRPSMVEIAKKPQGPQSN